MKDLLIKPDTLVGRYCLAPPKPGETAVVGRVVAEISPGVYLLQLVGCTRGGEGIVTLDDLIALKPTFYEDEEGATSNALQS